MWVFAIFVVVSVFVFIAGYRLIASAPEDPPPPAFNGAEPARGLRAAGDAPFRTAASSESLAIHYNRFLAAFLFASSLFILAAAFMLGAPMNAIPGVILLFVSVGYFAQPALVVTGSAVQHRNVLGMTMRETPFDSFSDFAFEGGTVWVKSASKSKPGRVKVIGIRFLYSGGDITKLQARAGKAS